jgi:hypothetical protein
MFQVATTPPTYNVTWHFNMDAFVLGYAAFAGLNKQRAGKELP